MVLKPFSVLSYRLFINIPKCWCNIKMSVSLYDFQYLILFILMPSLLNIIDILSQYLSQESFHKMEQNTFIYVKSWRGMVSEFLLFYALQFVLRGNCSQIPYGSMFFCYVSVQNRVYAELCFPLSFSTK